MEFTSKESTGVDRRIQVSAPVETVKRAEEKAARRYATKVRMPGFRQGKAPPAMIQKKFGKEIRQEALESLVRDAYEEVIVKQDLKIASQFLKLREAEDRPKPGRPFDDERFA